MRLTGGQFTLSTALAGNDLATFPDFPAEIRAPQGTLFGVSAFQINCGSAAIETADGMPVALVVIYDHPRPTFDRAVVEQNAAAAAGKKPDLQALISKGQTWQVEKEPHAS